jgi:hypothetical protein
VKVSAYLKSPPAPFRVGGPEVDLGFGLVHQIANDCILLRLQTIPQLYPYEIPRSSAKKGGKVFGKNKAIVSDR